MAEAGEKVVILRVGEILVSFPFSGMEEVVGPERIVSRATLPVGVGDRKDQFDQVSCRGRIYPVVDLLPGARGARAQMVVMRSEEAGLAVAVDQVVGFGVLGTLRPVPRAVDRATAFPLAGIRLWKGQVVLEIDLGRFFALH